MLLNQTPFGIFDSLNEMPESDELAAVVFRVGTLLCAVPARLVREILPPLPATRIPGAPPAVGGLVNVRGSLLTVLDAHRLLEQTPLPGDDGAVLVVTAGGRTCGLAVGEVRDFVTLPRSAVADRASLPGVDGRVVQAVGRHGGEHFIVLDLDALAGPIWPAVAVSVPEAHGGLG